MFYRNMASQTFLYFGFGSNLLRERLMLLNPSAKYKTIAKLKDYKLNFDYDGYAQDRSWRGCPATIVSHPEEVVWGVVWEMALTDQPNLDLQEGVSEGIYKPLQLDVATPDGEVLNCRTYQLLKTGGNDKRPSPQYMDVIIRGAKQSGLPAEYIETLQNIEHNGYTGPVTIYEEVLKSLRENQDPN